MIQLERGGRPQPRGPSCSGQGGPRCLALVSWPSSRANSRPPGYGRDEAAGHGIVHMHCIGRLPTQCRPTCDPGPKKFRASASTFGVATRNVALNRGWFGFCTQVRRHLPVGQSPSVY